MNKRDTQKTIGPGAFQLGPTSANSHSKLFPLFMLAGLVLPALAGSILAMSYIRFPHAPTPVFVYALLPMGLLAAAAGQHLSPDRWEGGTMEVLHLRVSYAALAYLAVAIKYAVAGRQIQRYPAGLLAAISGLVLVSRLLIKFRAKLFAAVRRSAAQ